MSHRDPQIYERTARGRLLNVAQVKEQLNCSRSWVYKLLEQGELKGVRLGTKKGLKVTEKSLERYKRKIGLVS